MSTRAVIGIVQDDGRILAARVAYDGDWALADKLQLNYASRLRATMLVSLGDILVVGSTPSECTLSPHEEEPVLVSPEGFEEMRNCNTHHYHLFDESGSWIHWVDEEIAGIGFLFDEE